MNRESVSCKSCVVSRVVFLRSFALAATLFVGVLIGHAEADDSRVQLGETLAGTGSSDISDLRARNLAGEEFLVAVKVVGQNDELLVLAGLRHLRMKPNDLQNYVGERARRGRKLPRGFQRVDSLVVESS